MGTSFPTNGEDRRHRFGKLASWYMLALGGIAAVAIAGQVFIQQHLRDQVSDSRVINLAGTQRYKSQLLVKTCLLVYADIDHPQEEDKVKLLEDLLEQWKKAHYALQHGDEELNLPGRNSEQVKAMFEELEPAFLNLYDAVQKFIAYGRRKVADNTDRETMLKDLLEKEMVFLDKMDKIVFQYDQEARQKVSTLSRLEFVLLGITILVIALEIAFIFRPTALQVSQTINQLILSERNAKQLSNEIGALYASLEKTYEELSIVNQPVENPRLFAKADKGGNVTLISEALAELTGVSLGTDPVFLADLFPGIADPDDWMDTMIDTVSEGESWQGVIRFEGPGKKESWAQVTVTPVYNERGEVDELVMTGSDITRRKEAEQHMHVKNRAEIDKKINRQKFRSVLILEGQEEERKRIAMDIHDGIGQMLTSLKFQIESIDLRDTDKAAEKIREIGQLTREIIREVRKVTFNLKPTVLGDFGLQAGLNVFIQEIGKLTDVKLVFETEGTIGRLPQKTENNIFRIIQEAINNAIKYSGANTIYIYMKQSEHELVITVKDEGKGFDPAKVETRNMNIESGRGFFNMYERTEYINGNLVIDSVPGKGTTVTLSVPLHAPVTLDTQKS